MYLYICIYIYMYLYLYLYNLYLYNTYKRRRGIHQIANVCKQEWREVCLDANIHS